jgi:ABC-type sugar transport system substrate-binding protein
MESKIGLFLVNTSEEYHRINARETQDAARRAGLDVEVFDAQNTASKQGQDIIRFASANVGKRLCSLVVLVSDATQEGEVKDDPTYKLARRALQKGMGWITLNHGREDVYSTLRSEFPKLPISFVAIDNVEFGRIQAQQLRELLPKGGTVLCVLGNPFDSACRGRTAGFKEDLGTGDFVLEEVDARWDGGLAETTIFKWLTSHIRRKSPLHAVVCQNDPMGIGAREALARASRETGRAELLKIPVLGGDGLPSLGQRWVNEGKLTATVCVTLPGKPAVELLAGHWHDGSALPLKKILAPKSYPALSALRPV